jgi:hypothetical protein
MWNLADDRPRSGKGERFRFVELQIAKGEETRNTLLGPFCWIAFAEAGNDGVPLLLLLWVRYHEDSV